MVEDIFLNSTLDWEIWDRHFLAYIAIRKLTDIVLHGVPPLEKPVEPSQASYALAYLAKDYPDRAAKGSSPPPKAGDAGDSNPQSAKPNGKESSIPVLSEVARSMYLAAMQSYAYRRGDYLQQHKDIADSMSYISRTVSDKFRKNCVPYDPLSSWYSSVKRAVTSDPYGMLSEAKLLYGSATRVLPKDGDILEWIDEWERAMDIGRARELPVAMSHGTWFDDLVKGIELALPSWVKSSRVGYRKDVTHGSLDYPEVISSLRQAVREDMAAQGRWPGRGAFSNPLPGRGGGAESGPYEKAPNDSPVPKKPAKAKPEPPMPPSNKRRRACRACDRPGHDLEGCFFIFPQLAPRGFNVYGDNQMRVNRRIEEDPRLLEEVNQLKRYKRGGQSDDGSPSRDYRSSYGFAGRRRSIDEWSE
ncbi:uncharacterized protein DNG_07090 [Cephalotrichum gorgonifer]|uniref:Uncharacterized protein n=1 Tax=Cephalotrichum gorgonifer TaxID=2041049 RepID=A0AAE8N3Z5_9PEZI|nr:uncharacterized protein DNG_07090 [Cephalotrichum gorgonifer]